MKNILLGCLMILTMPALAQTVSSKPNYIINVQNGSDDWAFALGPKNSADMGMTLIRQTIDGSIAFACNRKTGSQKIAVQFQTLKVQQGTTKRFHVTIGSDDRLIDMVSQANSGDKPSVFIANGPAAPAILLRMSEIAENLEMPLKFYDDEGDNLTFPLTSPRGIAGNASKICAGWYQAVVEPPKPAELVQPSDSGGQENNANGDLTAGGLHKPANQ